MKTIINSRRRRLFPKPEREPPNGQPREPSPSSFRNPAAASRCYQEQYTMESRIPNTKGLVLGNITMAGRCNRVVLTDSPTKGATNKNVIVDWSWR